MSSTLPSDPPVGPEPVRGGRLRPLLPFLTAAAIVAILEGVLWILPISQFDKSEAALIEATRQKIEAGNNQYRVLILGDSRSMSLSPMPPWEHGKQFPGVYNFSLPAMGTRYYLQYVQKYLRAGNRKPEAILFAGSPRLLIAGKGQPLVDPSLVPVATADLDLSGYLQRRSTDRLAHLEREFRKRPERAGRSADEVDWEYFSGRYTRMFSAAEAAVHYRGPERLFLISSMLPLYFRTYRYREAVLNLLDPSTYGRDESRHGTEWCSCERAREPVCQPPASHLHDNRLVQESRELRHGMYNISDRMTPEKRRQAEAAKPELLERFRIQAGNPMESIDYSEVGRFLEYLRAEGIRYYFVNMPFPSYFKDGGQLTSFDRTFDPFLARYPHAKRLHFPTEFISEDLFSDQVHLNCEGARLVNREFVESVLPALFDDLDRQTPGRR